MSVTDSKIDALQARIELLEGVLKDANGFILAKFTFANDPEAIEMLAAIQEALWPMPERWRKDSAGV